jgi:hypothetical protein
LLKDGENEGKSKSKEMQVGSWWVPTCGWSCNGWDLKTSWERERERDLENVRVREMKVLLGGAGAVASNLNLQWANGPGMNVCM